MKIFWSWQSDTPGNIGRHVVRASLDEAVAKLQQESEIEEAVRELHVDQDRQGVPGSPKIFDTIQEKIRESLVVIADVTPVSIIAASEGRSEKRNMNPNVAIELGFALAALGERKVLTVLNAHYGTIEHLPFDLAHLGGPGIFSLAPDATKPDIQAQKAILRGWFINALRGYIVAEPVEKPIPFEPIPSSVSPAIWFDPGETLADHRQYGEEDRAFYFDDADGIYLKLRPVSKLNAPLSTGILLKANETCPLGLLESGNQEVRATNRFGVIRAGLVGPNSDRIRCATQVFLNGEIWAISRRLLRQVPSGKIIPGSALAQGLRNAIRINAAFLSDALKCKLPYEIEFGAYGILDFSLAMTAEPDDHIQFHDNSVSINLLLKSVDTAGIETSVQSIIDELYRVAGVSRPQR